MMVLTLPYPPSNNRYYRNWKGRMLLSREGLAYRLAVLERRPLKGWPLLGRLRMHIHVFPDRTVSQDLDNIPKAICDALQKSGIFKNDSQIDDLRVTRNPKDTHKRVEITLEEI
jgi:crossover junction endodeoxyribonuclease RusA